MRRKSKKPVRKQTHSPTGEVVGQVGQILLPMIAGIAATKADLTEWVYEQGLTALHLLLREDAEKIAGPKGKHEKERTHNHWGSTDGELSFGGRRIQVSRPRVRSKSGAEASLPYFEAFRAEDPLPERVLNQILVGVSTRNYESSLDKPSAKLKSRGTSKSAASRHLVSQTTKKLEEYLSRGLEEFELAALMMDGLEVAGQTVVVTLGITIDGTKVPWVYGWVRRRTLGCAPRCCRTFSSGDCGSMDRFSVWWTEAKVSARHSSTFWGISWSSKDANSTNSEIYARTFPSPVTPTYSRQ